METEGLKSSLINNRYILNMHSLWVSSLIGWYDIPQVDSRYICTLICQTVHQADSCRTPTIIIMIIIIISQMLNEWKAWDHAIKNRQIYDWSGVRALYYTCWNIKPFCFPWIVQTDNPTTTTKSSNGQTIDLHITTWRKWNYFFLPCIT